MNTLKPPIPQWLPGASLILLGLLFYLPAIWDWPLSRSLAMYALIPKEMYESGQWLTPILNGARYLDKPPLLYWINLVAYFFFGVSDRTALLATLLIGLGEVWFTYLIGCRLLGTRSAWLGSFVLLTCIGFFTLHLLLLPDHLVTLGLVVAMWALVCAEDRPSWKWAVAFQVALAIGFLSKGFIGLAFPLMILAGYAWYRRQFHLLNLALDPRGWLVFLAIVLPWFWAMEQAHPGFLRHHILNEQILRFFGQRQPPDIIPISLPGFWLFLVIWLLPWGLLLPEVLYRFWRESSSPDKARRGRLLVLWAAVIMGFFTISSTRIEYYSLPALPPLALVLGWRFSQALEAKRDRSLTLALLLMGLLGLALLALLPSLEEMCRTYHRELYGMFPLLQPVARQASLWIPLLGLGGAVISWRRPAATLVCYGLLALALLFFTWKALVSLSPLLSDKLPGEYVRREAGPNDVVVMEAIDEFEYSASLAFYGGHRILMVQRRGMPQFPYPVSPQENFIITPEELRQLWEGPDRVFLLIDDVTQPESFLQHGEVVLEVPGKRLLRNHP